jgi:hypothetical protein
VLAHAAPPETSKTRWKPPNFYLTSSKHTHTHTHIPGAEVRHNTGRNNVRKISLENGNLPTPKRETVRTYLVPPRNIYIRWQECNKVIQMLRERVHPNTTEERERERPLQCKRKNAKSTAMSTSNRSHIQHSREREREGGMIHQRIHK